MSLFNYYVQVVRTLDGIGAPYMIVGAFGAISYGLNRGTHDIDIIVDLGEPHFAALAERFPPPRYYADPDPMREDMELDLVDKARTVRR